MNQQQTQARALADYKREQNEQWAVNFHKTVNLTPKSKKCWSRLRSTEEKILTMKNDFQAADEDPQYDEKLKALEVIALKFWNELLEVTPKDLTIHITGYGEKPAKFWLIE